MEHNEIYKENNIKLVAVYNKLHIRFLSNNYWYLACKILLIDNLFVFLEDRERLSDRSRRYETAEELLNMINQYFKIDYNVKTNITVKDIETWQSILVVNKFLN